MIWGFKQSRLKGNNHHFQVSVNSDSVTLVAIPNRFRVLGTGPSSQAIRIQASSPISVLAVNQGQNSCGGYTVLPVNSLKSEYYSLQYWPELVGYKRYSQIAVVAIEPTQISFEFITGRGVAVTYLGT